MMQLPENSSLCRNSCSLATDLSTSLCQQTKVQPALQPSFPVVKFKAQLLLSMWRRETGTSLSADWNSFAKNREAST